MKATKTLAALALAFSVFAAPASAADPVRGKALYQNTQSTGAPFACATGGCHGPDPTTNTNNIRKGVDPAAARRSKRVTVEWTFKKTATAYIEANRAGWKNPKHAQQWENTLATYAYPVFGEKHVRDVNKAS